MKLADRVRNGLVDNYPNYRFKRVLVAVSGGVDSTVLAHLLKAEGVQIGLVHCNFNLRGEASVQDAEFVRKLAGNLEVEFFYKEFNEEMKVAGESTQQLARKLRYAYFDKILKREGFDLIATAHHLNDNVETFFLNAIRKSGLNGLSAMKFVHNKLIRPFLHITRQEIVDYARSNDLDFREDESNKNNKYRRNRLRNQILPILREINPSLDENVAKTIEHLQETRQFVEAVLEQEMAKCVARESDIILIDKLILNESSHKQFLLWNILNEYGFSDSQITDLESAWNNTGRSFESESHMLVVDRNQILVRSKLEFNSIESFQIDQIPSKITGVVPLEFSCIETLIELKVPRTIALVDIDKITLPLTVRKWAAGDKFVPFGMKGSKKVSDFLIDQKVDLLKKQSIYVLVDGLGEIIWVIGHRVSDSFKVRKKVKKVLKIETLE